MSGQPSCSRIPARYWPIRSLRAPLDSRPARGSEFRLLTTRRSRATNTSRKRSGRSEEREGESEKRLVDAGVRIGYGTDSGVLTRFEGFGEHMELQLMVEAGMTPAQVITAATKSSAEFLGEQKDLGTLEQGKWADMIVLGADPLAEHPAQAGRLMRCMLRAIKCSRVLPRFQFQFQVLDFSFRSSYP